MKKCFYAENGAKPIGPYSPGVEANGFVFVSGQVGVDPAAGKMCDGIAAQTRQALTNIRNILLTDGLDMNNIVKTTVFLANIADFGAMNEVYKEFFTDGCPARSAFQVACLPGNNGGLVEIEAIAAR